MLHVMFIGCASDRTIGSTTSATKTGETSRPCGAAIAIDCRRFNCAANRATHERFGFADVSPMPAHEHIYPVPSPALANLAYFFKFHHRDGSDPATYVGPLVSAMKRWQRHAKSADLFSVDTGDHLVVCDLRPAAAAPLAVLGSVDRAICQACDAIADVSIADRIEALLARGLIIEDAGRYLSPAVPLGDYVPPPVVIARFYRLLAIQRRRGVESQRGSGRRRRSPTPARLRRHLVLPPEQFSVTPHGELVVRSYRRATERRS